MTKAIIYKKQDGGVATIYPSPGFMRKLTGLTEDQALQAVAERDVKVTTTAGGVIHGKPVPAGSFVKRSDAIDAGVPFDETPYEIVDQADLPDRTNREKTWRWQ